MNVRMIFYLKNFIEYLYFKGFRKFYSNEICLDNSFKIYYYRILFILYVFIF